MRALLVAALAIALAVALAGCAASASLSLPAADQVELRLAPGDRLKLTVYREEGLSGEYAVNDQGAIALPLVGEVAAAGKTVAALRRELGQLLAGRYVRDARISLDVVGFRPVYILGEVQKPGEYGYAERMSVHALVAKAGGFTYRANDRVVFVRHAGEGAETAYRLTSGAAVLPGDTLRIGARYF